MAQIKNFKLYINATPYTAHELENPTGDDFDIKFDHTPNPKNNSAPATPTTRPNFLDESEKVFSDKKEKLNTGNELDNIKQREAESPTNTQKKLIFQTATSKNTTINTKTPSNVSYTNRAVIQPVKNKETAESRALRSKKSTS
ncbi:hypothetical protein JTB14_019360 [Gonioctena quinquepunctata]|nr:hypothetical protein JTB14_019360 [Gonioctena quinquepunctata]